MPQATDELRRLMCKWFGDMISDAGPRQFLSSRGYYEFGGVWNPPARYHTMTPEEWACLRFLVEEWDHDYRITSPQLED